MKVWWANALSHDVPVIATWFQLHTMLYHDILKLPPNLPHFADRFDVNEMFRTPMAGVTEEREKKFFTWEFFTSISSNKMFFFQLYVCLLVRPPLLIDMEVCEMIALGNRKLLPCRITFFLSSFGSIEYCRNWQHRDYGLNRESFHGQTVTSWANAVLK